MQTGNSSQAERIQELEREVEKYRNMVMQLQRTLFGPKSERVEEIPPEQLVFNEIEVEAPKAPRETETITYTRRKGKQKKKRIPDDVPREEVIIDIAESRKICPHDGTRLKEIGVVVREKLKTIPARVSVVLEKIKKYACPCCESYVVQAKNNSILPGTIATPELLSFLIFSKFFQSLPLYRLEEFYKLNGIELRRGTMARWLVQLSEKLIPIWNILEEKVLESGYVNIDATHVQVLKEKDRKAETKSSMWVRGSSELGIVLFDYDKSGGGAVAKKLVTGFEGTLQADAHKGYGALDQSKILLLGCMMHSRRRFHEAWIKAEKKPGIAADGIRAIKFIYDKEDQYKLQGMTPEERKTRRDEEIGPSFEAFKNWCGWQLEKVPPSSPVAGALNYFINEYKELTAFLKDGRYEIDNGWVERQIKRFAIGRKNWLFCDSVEGARASSVLYSLTLTAKLNSKDPFDVMAKLLRELPVAKTIDDYERLAQFLLSEPNPRSCRKKEGALIN
jgi:transposase